MKSALVLLAFIAAAQARCPGSCSGHGACSASDKCTCYKMWDGPACDKRKCPSTISWSGESGHSYAVCGNRGICDSKSGVCQCYDGFEGKGCERMVCPENCNNHGTCEKMSEATASYDGWDEDKIQHCICDPGWTGPGCETRMCKPGDDSMTTQKADNPSQSQAAEVQELSFTHGSALAGSVLIGYSNWNNEVYLTYALDVASLTATALKEALEALPNQAIPAVEVNAEGSLTATSRVFRVTFSDASNSGDQTMLVVKTNGCGTSGCQPNYAGSTATIAYNEITKGSTESDVCSGRGDCDGDTGICQCFEGYYGEMCQKQNSIE